MYLIIDANIVIGYFKEKISIPDIGLTDSPTKLFENANSYTYVFDDKGIIQQEWRQHVDIEWFDAWLSNLYRDDKIFEITYSPCLALRKRLIELGFPKQSRDYTYLRTAVICKSIYESSILSEDMDFFDPKKKGEKGPTRIKSLIANQGPIVSLFKKNYKIRIYCLKKFLEI